MLSGETEIMGWLKKLEAGHGPAAQQLWIVFFERQFRLAQERTRSFRRPAGGIAELADTSSTTTVSLTEIGPLTPGVTYEFWLVRSFGGIVDSSETADAVCFHPEGMSAISRGLSVCDTPGTTAQKGDLHPEGMLAGS